MTIATLNIDWAKKGKTKIEAELTKLDADILVLTETIDSIVLPVYQYAYKSRILPEMHEGINYKTLIRGNAIRTAVYSKYPSERSLPVADEYTSVCEELKTDKGLLTIYATIVGTQFNKGPAELELQNCISDCLQNSAPGSNFCLAGDLNTAFRDNDSAYQIPGINSKRRLLDLCKETGLELTTGNIERNIDHILLSKAFVNKTKTQLSQSFIEKCKLSDHMGIVVTID